MASHEDNRVVSDVTTEQVQIESCRPEFYIHKALIQSLSPELSKHVNNDMREGHEGIMELSDVDDETMQAFMEWAYTKEYSVTDPKSPSALLCHTKLYVLADRFNIIPLGSLSYSRFTALLAELGMMSREAGVEAVMSTVAYAFDNLPFSALLKYLMQYVSWSLDVLRNNSHFSDLLATSHDFARALVASSPAARSPPWNYSISS
ncbi:hypothetical protein BDZ91DRAFT_668854 [Kalaharituber pfeilii]|nr:hypothetical protein BDZ91DRAFT_668854 [Kalaharituber pfeilii]